MPALRRLYLIVALCLLAASTAVLPCAAQGYVPRYDGRNARVVDFNQLPATPVRCFAVVGDVERPGVYYTTDRKVSRARVLTRGGSLADMGGYYTTYNSGLSKTSSAIFDALTTEAANGDVIVVTGKKKQGMTLSSADFYVATIGLKPEPVVIRLPASQRSLAGLIARLKQHPEVAAAATVNGVKSTEPLKNGDVIVLNAQFVDRTAPLDDSDFVLQPQPLDPPSAPGKATSAEAPVIEHQLAALPVLEAPALGSSQLPAAAEVVEPAQAPATLATSTSIHSGQLVESKTLPDLQQALPPTPLLRATRPTANARQSVQNADYQTVTETVRGPSVRSLVILSALGTLGLGIALLWIASERRLRTAMPVPVPIEPALAVMDPPRDEFADLVGGKVDVEDEPVVLPAKIALHGHAVGQKRLIIHPPEPLAGPHFGNVGSTEKASAARPVRTPVASESPVGPVRSPRDTEGLLDRVLLAMQREGRK